MTRRTIVILFTLFSSLVVTGIASPISADTPGGMSAPQQCAQVADDDVLAPAPAVEQRPIYHVADSYYYFPAANGMWAVFNIQAGGPPVIEDYVSGPPPADGVAITQPREASCTVIPTL